MYTLDVTTHLLLARERQRSLSAAAGSRAALGREEQAPETPRRLLPRALRAGHASR